MNTDPKRRRMRLLAMVFALAAFALATPPAPADAPIWSIEAISIAPGGVDLVVRNAGATPLCGRVLVQAVVAGDLMLGEATVTVPANAHRQVHVPFPSTVASVLSVGFSTDVDSR